MNEEQVYVDGEVAYERATILNLRKTKCRTCNAPTDPDTGELGCTRACDTYETIRISRNRIADLKGEGE